VNAQHLTRFPVVRYRSGFLLQTLRGERISFHRTYTGALRKRRELIEEDHHERNNPIRQTGLY
jgi:hypothetical protein